MNQQLDGYLAYESARGARVLNRADSWAVIARGNPINHVLHLLLSVFTCSLWFGVWLSMTAFGGERRITARIAPGGEVVEQKQPLSVHRILAMIAFAVWALFWLFVFIGIGASNS